MIVREPIAAKELGQQPCLDMKTDTCFNGDEMTGHIHHIVFLHVNIHIFIEWCYVTYYRSGMVLIMDCCGILKP